MRLVLAVALAGLVALPLSVSAQAGEESTEPNVEEPAPPSEPAPEEPPPSPETAPEEPALELKLDAAGVEVAPSPPRTAKGYTLEEMELRVKRAKIGLGISVPFILVGTIVTVMASAPDITQLGETEENPIEPSPGGIAAGIVMTAGAVGGTIASSIMLRKRKRALSELRLGRYGPPPRTRRGYTPEEAQLRVKRARIGLGASAGTLVLGIGLVVAGRFGDCRYGSQPVRPSSCDPLTIAGATFIGVGVIGMTTTGIMSLRRKRDRDWLRRAHFGAPRRVQWDLARSRLVF